MLKVAKLCFSHHKKLEAGVFDIRLQLPFFSVLPAGRFYREDGSGVPVREQ